MSMIAVIRHGATAWNAEKRIQGRRDIPLSAAGRTALEGSAVPEALTQARWLTSPLSRARETARLLGPPEITVEPRLIEMDWGAWEGRTVAELRDEYGADMLANEARGRDFRPPAGETPADVIVRLAPLLAEIADAGTPTVAVTHKGVIRALLAWATGWDMMGRAPEKLEWNAAHLFEIDASGQPRPRQLNLPLRVSLPT